MELFAEYRVKVRRWPVPGVDVCQPYDGCFSIVFGLRADYYPADSFHTPLFNMG